MIETNGKFYVGRLHDPRTGQTGKQPMLYDPDDLTTHAVVVGMTGSGKTGLCIDLLEEAALNNIPALMVDPKGDITNALLHFPDLAPADFEPWINADEARREGKTTAQAAGDAASLWRNGLAEWGISQDRLRALKESAHFAIYTPGSSAGLQISILASLAAPDIPWSSNKELFREKISGTVTALLGLIGLDDIDPVRSREHILLANIFEHAWSKGHDLDLGELIMQTQSPPFEKLGVFDIDRFFPQNDRFDLAMMLNNILAAPAFQAWIEGEPLNVGKLLFGEDGRPKHTIFYVAHLPEQERMFFVTLLYSAVESWMHSQAGSSSLRALVYFDEIAGYLPPTKNPPSKEPMMRMLKQARAFGVAMVLAAQNPADIDYKALSNAGTWFIGKLATEQDKNRLLDGLSSAMPGGLDRREYDMLISSLGKRVFLLRNVHEKQPHLFQTRWAMNYLAGPMTRNQIPLLNALAGAVPGRAAEVDPQIRTAVPSRPMAAAATSPSVEDMEVGHPTRPTVPARVSEYFMPVNLSLPQAAREREVTLPAEAQTLHMLYRPSLLAHANVRFLNRKYNLNHELQRTVMIPELDRRGAARWAQHEVRPIEEAALERGPAPNARFAGLEAPMSDATVLRSLRADYVDWIYRSTQIMVMGNEKLKVYAGPDESQSAFRRLCSQAAAEKADVELDRIEARYERKIESIEKKLSREEQELREDEADLAHRKREEFGTHAETILSLFSKRRRSVSSSLSKRRMTSRAKADVEESVEAIAEFKEELEELETEMAQELADIKQRWADIAADSIEIPVNPYKKDVNVSLYGVAWVPYYLVQIGDRTEELPGYLMEELSD
jgi:hypothetical protein